MREYEVTAYYSETVRVKADSEEEALSKGKLQISNMSVKLIPDCYEVEEAEED